jgi:hypothetical protein
MIPDANYVTAALMALQQEMHGLHTKMAEMEALRYGEDRIALSPGQRPSGIEFKSLMAADMIESVKAAILAKPPRAHFEPIRNGDKAKGVANDREKFWNAVLDADAPMLYEFVDGVVGLGFSAMKAAYSAWPTKERERTADEAVGKTGDRKYNTRLRGLKQRWGMPYARIAPHPMTLYWRRGVGNKFTEMIEHAWKSKLSIYGFYGLDNDADAKKKARGSLAEDVSALKTGSERGQQLLAERLSAMSGQPEAVVRQLPAGMDTTTMCLVTEYWNAHCYQVYVDRHLIYEEAEGARVHYFPALGRTSISPDPDKVGLSVAEALRLNEPVINRELTRMGEAVELAVRQRRTVTLPDNTPQDVVLGADNRPQPRSYKFEEGNVESLPSGANVVNVFEGVDKAFAALPFLQLELQLITQHGVAPIFKGTPPGAAGSGYRDNSLYLMAQAQFKYLIDSIQRAIVDYIEWMEQEIVRLGEDVWIGGLRLRPKDIEEYPVQYSVKMDPALPQNMVQNAQLYMDAHQRGFGTEDWVYEKGFQEEQPESLQRGRILELAQRQIMPIMITDALRRTGVLPPTPLGEEGAEEPGSGLVGPDGRPISSERPGGPGGAQQVMQNERQQPRTLPTGVDRAGQARQPPRDPGTV